MDVADRIAVWYALRKINQLKKEGKMNKILEFLKGKKTYINALLIGACAAAQALGYPIPEWVYGILGALGLVTLRAGIKSETPATK